MGSWSARLGGRWNDDGVAAVLLEIDSPGGEVSGCFDLADMIFAARGTKPIWAVANDAALSAAYALGSACDRVIVTRTGGVGSIGVVAAHRDQSAADQRAGLEYSFVQAGARKTDGNPHRPLGDDARARMQAEVDRVYDLFIQTVGRNRALDAEAVRQTEAEVYTASNAVTAGLADAVQPFSEVVDELSAYTPKHTIVIQSKDQEPMDDPETSLAVEASNDAPEASDVVTPKPILALPKPDQTTAPDAEAIEQNLRAQFAEISAIANQAAKLGVTVDVSTALEKRVTPMALRKQVLDQLAAKDVASAVVATPEPGADEPKASTGSGLMAAAQAEAKRMKGEDAHV